MHSLIFIEDLAIIMLISAAVTVLFHRFKQPVVLGYITAGAIIGPFTPAVVIIHDESIIKTLAELGVVFLMFSLGLEFNLRKIFKVGIVACVAASAEILVMTWLGYEVGQFFQWGTLNSLFLGGMLAISSTTIIIKALQELGLEKEDFAQLIFGILIVEDILGIVILALLSSIAIGGQISANDVILTLSQISSFIVVSLIVGILLVPRILAYVAKFKSQEMLLITTLGLCFGFCLLVIKLEYSIALGAFIIGAIIAESKQIKTIEHLVEPLRDMFSAIFFVAIGLLLDPQTLVTYTVPIAVITIVVVLGKIIACTSGTFISGYDGRTSLKVGMSIAQIGEFSFIIATLGVSLGVTSDFLYPTVVAVSAITTLFTPYLIKAADPLASGIANILPRRMRQVGEGYTNWLQDINEKEGNAQIIQIVRNKILQIMINIILITGIFSLAVYFDKKLIIIENVLIRQSILWSLALLFSLPFLVAVFRKTHMLSGILTEISLKSQKDKKHIKLARSLITVIIPIMMIAIIMTLLFKVGASILPTMELVVTIFVVAAVILVLWWQWFVRLHIRAQIALTEQFHKEKK